MPDEVEQKVMDPDAELSNAMRQFLNLASECSIQKRARGNPTLAPQEKQIRILKNELYETELCIQLGSKGRHAICDAQVKSGILKSLREYEAFLAKLRVEKGQQTEMDLLNYLSTKLVVDLKKKVPVEANELSLIDKANVSLRRTENKLDIVTKQLYMVNAENLAIREEIHRLLKSRESFNLQWKSTINKLMKGKEYLKDILEIATNSFDSRDEASKKLETLKWRGLAQLNKDITEMQLYDGEINHLSKLEEFLRVKGSKRVCEADEIEEAKKKEEIAWCEKEIARHDELLDKIFAFAGTDRVSAVIENYKQIEIENMAKFILLCQLSQESKILEKEVFVLRQRILDQCDINQSREEIQEKRLAKLAQKVDEQNEINEIKREQKMASNAKLFKVLQGIEDLIRLAKCNRTPLLSLLGNHNEVTKFNVHKFINILESEVHNLIQIGYKIMKSTRSQEKSKAVKAKPSMTKQPKLVAEPHVVVLRPNRIDTLVPYKPCAYCVEDYLMNLVYETNAVPADKAYIDSILHLEEPNTDFGIYTLTNPAKRHHQRNENINS